MHPSNSGRLRTYAEVTGEDRSRLGSQVAAQRERVAARLASVRHTVGVMSGKGGVGKSFLCAGLARALAKSGRAVGVLDADLAAPTTARMLGVGAEPLAVVDGAVRPARDRDGVRVMSTDLLLNDGAPLRWREPEHERFVWRGTLETGMLREFLADVEWGSLDVLLVDLPPGIDRLESLTELVPGISGVLAVTIPSDASERAVRRALAATAERGTRVLGIVENMSGYLCDGCSEVRALFPGDAGASLSSASGAPLLARLPFHPGADDGALAAEFGRLSTGLWDRLESE